MNLKMKLATKDFWELILVVVTFSHRTERLTHQLKESVNKNLHCYELKGEDKSLDSTEVFLWVKTTKHLVIFYNLPPSWHRDIPQVSD